MRTPDAGISRQTLKIVIRNWNRIPFSVNENDQRVEIRTAGLQVYIRRKDGSVSFYTPAGKSILQKVDSDNGQFLPKMEDARKTWRVEQSFLSPRDEALYGLGQHQEGSFNLHGISFRLQRANTNISIPVLLSTRGHRIIWNNASVTDFDPANQPIAVDPQTGVGSFRVEAPGDYSFMIGSDRTEQLRLTVDEGDSYRYEKGSYSTIALSWNDGTRTLSIRPRIGSFPGMLSQRTFRLFLVGDGHGLGIQSGNNPDQVTRYDGHPISLDLAGRHLHVKIATIAEEK